jgi:sterol 3beta-glucosyltransferase
MRITVFTHGSRGDIWPLVALASQLAERDHDVTVAVTEEFRAFTESAGLRTEPLPFDVVAWLKTPEGQRLLDIGGIPFIRGFKAEFDRHAAAFDDAFEFAAQGAEAIVAMHNTWDRALVMADLLRIPIATVYPIPTAPSREYASAVITNGNVRTGPLRLASHKLTHQLWWRGGARSTNAFRRKLGLPECWTSTYNRLQLPGALGLCNLSPSLFPRPTDWPEHHKVTGPWKMPDTVRAAVGEDLPTDLEAWLDAGPAPIFLGFGSMPVLEPQALLANVLAVTDSLSQRAIVNADWIVESGVADALPDHIRPVGALDHDRLFPRCVAVVHHGGAGSTITSTRAGCPTMVCSVLADQPWWGELLKRRGVGTHIPFRKLNRERLQEGVRTLLRPDVRARAQVLGEAMRAEGDGLPAAAQLLDDWLVTAEPTPCQPARATLLRTRATTSTSLARPTAAPKNQP